MKRYSFKLILPALLALFLSTGCRQTNKQESKTVAVVTEAPSEIEKATAIKDMLRQGVERAVETFQVENGSINNDSLEILLSKDMQNKLNRIKKIPFGKQLVDNMLSQIGEVAGIAVAPLCEIIHAAIDSMTVEEANHILYSDSAAATQYLQKVARKPLHEACDSIILPFVNQKMEGDVTPKEAWSEWADKYNKVASSSAGKIAKLPPVEPELDSFITEKLLDAVFQLIAKEEMNIRKHPTTRVSQSMAKTLGWLDANPCLTGHDF